jgi:hypothetical protein
MKLEYYRGMERMVDTQLQEEKITYDQAVITNKQPWKIKEIMGRIKSLQKLLLSLNSYVQKLSTKRLHVISP